MPTAITGCTSSDTHHAGAPEPETHLIGSLDPHCEAGITEARLWTVKRRYFQQAATVLESRNPVITEKLRRARPHWMRHTHATHALEHGTCLTVVRDNLRHASIATTSIYLHSDEATRAPQIGAAFAARREPRYRSRLHRSFVHRILANGPLCDSAAAIANASYTRQIEC